MPACRRETAGWLSTTSQLGRRPIFRPSVTRVTGSTSRSSRSMMKLLSCVCISLSADGEEDDLDDVDEHQRQHQRGRDDVRREPELEQLVQVDERVHAPERHRRLDGFEQELARLGVEAARLGLVGLARRGEQRRQLLAPKVLAQEVAEGEDAPAHLLLDELPQVLVAVLADLGERLAQLLAARAQVLDEQGLALDARR